MIQGVRVFDTILDGAKRKDTVSRNAADFWRPMCKSAGWAYSHERVHSLADLKYFFSKKIEENVIIFSGHGEVDGFHLSNGEVFTPDALADFPDKNAGKIVIFSSCFIGKNAELTLAFKQYFAAFRLFAYTELMYDRFCFLNESILLTLMEKAGNNFTDSQFADFQSKTDFLKNLNKKHVKNHPMVMF